MKQRGIRHALLATALGAGVLVLGACTQQPTTPAATTAPATGAATAPAASPAAKSAASPATKAAASPATKAASPTTAASPAAKTAASPVAKTAPSPVAKTAASPSPAAGGALKIGVLVPFTGDLSDFGPAMFNAAQLAAEQINEAGGVNGRPIEIVRGDTGTSPQQGTQEARRLIDVERVNAIIGAAASGVTLPIAESVTGPAQIIQISPASTSPALTTAKDNGYLFRTTISDAAQGNVLAELANSKGFKSACTLYVNNAYGQGLSQQFAQTFQSLGGTVTAQVPHEQQQASYSAELQRCAQGNPDVLVAISYPESAQVYLREAVEQGVADNFLFTDGPKSQDLFDALGAQNFEGMGGTAPGTLNTQAGNNFDQAYEQKYGQRPPLPFLRESYDAVYVIALAAEKANSVQSSAIQTAIPEVSNPPGTTINPGVQGWNNAESALQSNQDINYEGAATSADFDQNGDILKGGIEIWTIRNGQITTERVEEVDLSQR